MEQGSVIFPRILKIIPGGQWGSPNVGPWAPPCSGAGITYRAVVVFRAPPGKKKLIKKNKIPSDFFNF